MKYFKYTFLCQKIPTRLTMHSIVSHFIGKDNIVDTYFKVEKNGKLITIKTKFEYNGDFKIELQDRNGRKFICELKNKEEVTLKEYKSGEVVNIHGLVEYGVNITGSKGKRCPFFKGKFNSDDLRNKFKSNIERSLGVKVDSMSRDNFSRLESEIASEKIQFNNIIEMDLNVIVVDTEIFNTLQYRSVFQKKTYGFGNLNIS